jgi:hypothetical protein
LVGKPEGKETNRLTGVDGRIILKIYLQQIAWDGVGLDLTEDMDKVAGSCECGNELSDSIKCREFR